MAHYRFRAAGFHAYCFYSSWMMYTLNHKPTMFNGYSWSFMSSGFKTEAGRGSGLEVSVMDSIAAVEKSFQN